MLAVFSVARWLGADLTGTQQGARVGGSTCFSALLGVSAEASVRFSAEAQGLSFTQPTTK